MDYGRENVVHVIQTNAPENWVPNSTDTSVWATEEDYRVWNNHDSSTEDQRQPQSWSNSEQPPNKKPKNSSQESNSRSRAIGKMFFKTKLCCKFRVGTCPYITNCNFAHSIEELRRPPPNWQEIVAANEDERGISSEPREEFQIPALVSSNFSGETQRSYKGRHCKKFYTEEGCPYGDNCTFLHDEQSKNRESVAISLGPGGYAGGGGGGGSGGGGGGGGNGPNVKPSNWKTRICNKWELTGYCPFGNKCHFAHGVGELHGFGGGLVDAEAKDSSAPPFDSKQGGGVPSKTPADTLAASAPLVPLSDVYRGVPSQRTSIVLQKPGQRTIQKWKGPDKISRIYGDWIDDIE
ncbi:Zinc finger CCCH domain-containing protein 12 [Hibiscus syriacus]|uniref:Zinc finger CCCH domain-containing protein 12 n=1 Tax=Hibiscus syriacus TaxID=106335 RepID=A0A6A2Y8V6_HIBSY|nr:zinc finger CCCH domain-containing protein 12-like [Hibiscus syriacus]KAE8678505.1 Zinc finger CCCH domain-containing protein 12 [Hibiscus syriacus]